MEVYPPETRLFLAFQKRHGENPPPAVREEPGQTLAHGGCQAEKQGCGAVLQVLYISNSRLRGGGTPAWGQAGLGYRAKASPRLLPLALANLVIDAEALVQVPMIADVLDFRPRGTVELLYPDWFCAHLWSP